MLENDLPPNTNPTTVYLKDYREPDFLVLSISIEFYLGAGSTVVKAKSKIQRQGTSDAPLVLDGEKMQLRSVSLNGDTLQESHYKLNAESLIIESVPDEFTLVIETEMEPHLNTELSGLYQSSGNFCTQCEAEGFRRITYFPDRPDVLSVYDVTITADKLTCPVLLSNGNLIDRGDNDDGTHWAHWHDPHPKPSYLFALVAGDLSSISGDFTTASGRSVELNIYTQAHNIDKCDHALQSLQKAMLWDEQTYGREYDLDLYNVVAVDDFNMGAMENKGLNIFNSKYVLADQHTATDADYEGIESVIGHEYFHNWSGNRVTCRDWFQLSLKEGFTVFRDQEFSADMGSRAVKRIRDVQVLRAHQFKEDAGPMAHPVRPQSYQEINNFYTVTIYNKGAEVIRMLHRLVGASGFRKGTDLYFESYDGQAVTTEDFVKSIEAANAADFQQFRLWYTQSGTPNVEVEQTFDGQSLCLKFQQTCAATPGQPEKKPFQIPISMALFDRTGKKILTDTLVLDQAQQSYTFDGLTDCPVVSLLRDFSAPVKLHFAQSDDDLAVLIAHDDNGFAQWEAMQRLSLNLLLPAVESGELDEAVYARLVNALRSLIQSNPRDKAIFAEMLTLPSSGYIAELCSPVNPQRIAMIRDNCVRRLAKDLEAEFHLIYADNNQQQEFSLTAQATAERSLKNRALSYLVATDQAAYYALASHQYHAANNMTDRLAAFASLVHFDYQEKAVLVEHFYQQWKDDNLVVDKWFAMQALAPTESALEQVVALMSHPAFSINNPNKVRSLIGTFTGNLMGFHQKDGTGYEFLADQIIELNKLNPQVAARLASVLNNWRSYSEPYKSAMKTQLERIHQTPGLTKDVAEIIGKALVG